jgi:hypothetical protein
MPAGLQVDSTTNLVKKYMKPEPERKDFESYFRLASALGHASTSEPFSYRIFTES